MVLLRELCGNAVDEKSVTEGIGVGYPEDPRWAKKINPTRGWEGGGGGILKNHLSCTVCYFSLIIILYGRAHFIHHELCSLLKIKMLWCISICGNFSL